MSIASRYEQANFDSSSLPDIAAEALGRSRPHDHVTFTMILEQAMAGDVPVQVNPYSAFGEPDITLFTHPRFFIQALFWTTGTTAVHEHSFSGAFSVLQGSSIQTRFDFRETLRVNAQVLLGELVVRDVRLLAQGDIESIQSGRALIHSVFHLDCPSVTLVVRTVKDVDAGPQYSYHRPHLAVDPFSEDYITHKRLQTLATLRKIDVATYERYAERAVSRYDFYTAVRVLMAHDPAATQESRERLIEACRK